MMKHGAKVQLNQMSTDERRQLLESSIDKARVGNPGSFRFHISRKVCQ